MTTADETEVDPAVCYRHPSRQSWVLCQRCGRTICPECQILAPVGVQCPECVREAGGSVKWTPTGGPRPAAKKARSRSSRDAVVRNYFATESGPHVSWIIIGVTTLLWIVGFFTSNAPYAYLASGGGAPWQLWRYATSWLVEPSIADGGSILLFIFGMALLGWFGPYIERMLGRSRFALIFIVGAMFGGAIGVLAGGISWGLDAGLYAVFVVYGIQATRSGSTPVLLWVLMGFNILYTAVAATAALPQLIGGLVAGIGMWWLFDVASSPSSRTKAFIAWGAVVVAIALATLRLVALG